MLRAERDSGAFGQAMDRLRIACEGTENTMPFILDAVRAYATQGVTEDEILEEYPRLQPGDMRAPLAYAAEAISGEAVFPLSQLPSSPFRGRNAPPE